jgi:plastocyanin
LHHSAFEPNVATAAPGTSIVALNADQVPHDVMLIRTTLSADELPTKGSRVDEADTRLASLGRTPRVAPQQIGSVVLPAQPGRYVLVCSVPHHDIRNCMVARLTIRDDASVDS